MKKTLSLVLCLVIALSVVFTGCGTTASQSANNTFKDGDVLGKGATQFTFTVTDADGNKVSAEIHTDKMTVGEALVELGVIAGDSSEYGLYVKTVNGITLDYDKDGKYWAFYIDGQFASTGVDSTEIKAGSTYEFAAQVIDAQQTEAT